VLKGPGWSNQQGGGYEVSSRGDKRFSALFARLPDGRLIEDAWGQAKGYADGRAAKGKPALTKDFDYWGQYKGLWSQWAQANPGLMDELAQASQGQPLVDRFAKTENNQARALAELLAERSAAPAAAPPPAAQAPGVQAPALMPEQPAAAANPTGQQTADAVQLDLWEKGKRFAGDAWPYLAAAGGAGLVGYAVADLMGRGSGGDEVQREVMGH
jgi:hypothetical protein